MTTETTLYECHGWKVTPDDDDPDYPYAIRDTDGDTYEWHRTPEEAIARCREEAEAAYRERLTELLTSETWDDMPLHVLQTVCHILGHKVD
jgi:hypothetical protein